MSMKNENFMNGFFTFNKSCSEFSNMALDQIHEQNNDLIKGVGGATHLINREDDSALLRWEMCRSELAGMISSFEDEVSVSNDKAANYGKHHEDTVSFRNRFVSDVNKLVKGFNVNPFDLNHLTAINNVTITFSEEVAESIKSISSLGEQLFLQFWNERLIQAKVPISAKIPNNNLKLPAHLDSTSSVNDPYLTSSMIAKLRSAY